MYNCDLAKIKQSNPTKNNNTELHVGSSKVRSITQEKKSIYCVCKWSKEVRQ
jgi:Icc-related predicted phosphoesterase